VNPETRAFEVDITLPNAGSTLKPGMFGKADIVVERRLDTIAVDKSVVTRRNNEDVVFIAVEQADAGFEVARMVPVTLGLESKDQIEILSGLKTGDRVITRNFEVLQDNTRISAIDVDEPLRPGAAGDEEPKADENIAEKPGDDPGPS
jgi:multidrug efflux pump subunit AcrA (membrane-fusion protein)